MSTVVCSPAPNRAGEHPRLRRIVGGVLALLAALVAVLAAPARPAHAHAQLVGTTPANGARLASSPPEIVLRFSERVNLVRDGVALLTPDGPVAGTGPARLDPATSTQVSVAVPATLGDGVYTVSWRVVSADSHPIHGAFVFAVGDVELGPLPAAGAQTDADPALSAIFWLFRWLGYAGLALLAGGVCFLVFCWPPGLRSCPQAPGRARRVVTVGWATSLVCATGVLLLQGPYAAGATLARVADPALLTATLATDFGRYMLVRLGLLAAGGLALLGLSRIHASASADPSTSARGDDPAASAHAPSLIPAWLVGWMPAQVLAREPAPVRAPAPAQAQAQELARKPAPVRAQELAKMPAPVRAEAPAPVAAQIPTLVETRARALGLASSALLAGALPATWVGTGHANAAASLLAAVADTAHLSAMAIWFGGLVVLVSCVLPASPARELTEVAGAVSRFSRIATVCVAVLVVTGTYQAWRGVGSLAALAGSTYGALLVFKLAIVGVLVTLGAMSRSLVRRRYVLPATSAAPAEPVATTTTATTARSSTSSTKASVPTRSGGATVATRSNRAAPATTRAAGAATTRAAGAATTRAAGPVTTNRSERRAERARLHQDVQARRQLRTSVRAEVVIALAVLALTSMLVATPPATRPDAAQAAAAEPVVATAQLAIADGGQVDVRLDPASLGLNSLTLGVSRADGTAWDVPEVTASLLLPAQNLGPLPVALTKVGPGEYTSPELNVPAPGTWRLQVTVRTTEIDQTTVATDIPVT